MNDSGSGFSERKPYPILKSLDEQGRGVCVKFQWHEDRLAHLVSLINGERQVPLLASLEGKQSELWPQSPPLQNFHVEQRENERCVILAVGMAGNSHWSMSVAAEEDRPEIVWDIACRVKQSPIALASGYRSMVTPKMVDSQNAIFELSGMSCHLSLVKLDEQPLASLELLPDGLSIRTAPVGEPFPRTVQWQYRLRLG